MLPVEKQFPDLISHFPTRWQAVVFRNYGIVPTARIAAVLKTDEKSVVSAAREMGLSCLCEETDISEKAYVTVLRSNWHLLCYDQLIKLLNVDEKKLESYLYEDDFCFEKLGDKPVLGVVTYRDLTPAERERTAEIAAVVKKYSVSYAEAPFDFLKRFSNDMPSNGAFNVLFDGGAPREDYAEFLRRHYDLSRFSDKKIVCRTIQRNGWDEEDFSVSEFGDGYVVEAVCDAGLLRGLQHLAENPQKSFTGEKHSFALKDRIIYSYFAPCGDIFLSGGDCGYPDGLLAELAKRKINGIWLHGILRLLSPFKWGAEYSKGYEKRLDNLNALIKRASAYGIKVWLYLNEPRCMPISFFDERPELLGSTEGKFGALCTSQKEVLEWLSGGVEFLLKACPELGGIITITMSENLTNCLSRTHVAGTGCPRCAGRTPDDAASEVNRAIQSAVDKAGTGAKLIAWTWGWAEYLHWDRAAIDRGLAGLDEKTIVMCTSEDAMRVKKGKVRTEIIDYTMSNIGPSKKTKRTFSFLRQRGRTAYAKIQANTTWECAAVPYIPVFPSVDEHVKNLLRSGARGMLMSWTLGGYPTVTLDMIARRISDVSFDPKNWYNETFGKDAVAVYSATRKFSRAFKAFPFSLDLLYNGPQNVGPANLLYEKPTGLSATMVGYPFDNLKKWRGPFGEKEFIGQFGKLASEWGKACEFLRGVSTDRAKEVAQMAEAVYIHFYSTYLQARFIALREQPFATAEIKKIIAAERENTVKMLKLQSENSAIGYEASNQYFYYKNTLLEKLVNLDMLDKKFDRSVFK